MNREDNQNLLHDGLNPANQPNPYQQQPDQNPFQQFQSSGSPYSQPNIAQAANNYGPNPNQGPPAFPNSAQDNTLQGNNQDGFAIQVNPLMQQKKSRHFQVLIATLFFLIGQGILWGMYFGGVVQLQIVVVAGIALGIYVIYLIIAFTCNPLIKYMKNMERGENFNQQYDRVTAIHGKFRFSAICYHYETRHHTRTVRTNDVTRTQHYTTTEKVVTHSAQEDLLPKFTKDDSGDIDEIRAMTNIIFVQNIVKYKFSDPGSQRFFENYYNNFRMRNLRDAHQNYSYKYVLPPYAAQKSFFIGELNCLFITWFYISGMFVVVWPYCLWVESLITRFDILFMKILTF